MRAGAAQHDAVHRVELVGLEQRGVQFAQQRPLSALRFSGRFSVTIAVLPLTS